jgi:hypothetical protein
MRWLRLMGWMRWLRWLGWLRWVRWDGKKNSNFEIRMTNKGEEKEH